MAQETREFKRVPKRGLYVRYGPDVPDGGFAHYFCGSHSINGAVCPNCDKPLLRILSLDTNDARMGWPRLPFPIPLLFCWTCNVSQDLPFIYRLEDDGSVSLLRHGKGRVGLDDFPYDDYPAYFPGAPVALSPVPEADEEAMVWHLCGEDTDELQAKYGDRVDEVFDAGIRHQLGGAPLFAQGPPYESCPTCGQPAPFFVSLADDNLDSRGFTDNCGVQVLVSCCMECRVMIVTVQCD